MSKKQASEVAGPSVELSDVDDVPDDFFEAFEREDFMESLDVVDSWEDIHDNPSVNNCDPEPLSDLEEQIEHNIKKEHFERLGKSITNKEGEFKRRSISKNDYEERKKILEQKKEKFKADKERFLRKYKKNNPSDVKNPDLDYIIKKGSRRDPAKTIRDIKKDKEIKIKEYLTKSLECGDNPPGTELEEYFQSEQRKKDVAVPSPSKIRQKRTESPYRRRENRRSNSSSRMSRSRRPFRRTPRHSRSRSRQRTPFIVEVARKMKRDSDYVAQMLNPHRARTRDLSPGLSKRYYPRERPSETYSSPYKPHYPIGEPLPPNGPLYAQGGGPVPLSGATFHPGGEPYPYSGGPYTPNAEPYLPSRAPFPQPERQFPPIAHYPPDGEPLHPPLEAPSSPLNYLPPPQEFIRKEYPLDQPPYPPPAVPQPNDFYSYPVSEGMGSVQPPVLQYSQPSAVPAPVPPPTMLPSPVLPPAALPPSSSAARTPKTSSALDTDNSQDALDKLLADGKISITDYLKLTSRPKGADVSSTAFNLNRSVLARCEDAILKLGKLHLPNRLIVEMNKRDIEPPAKFRSPLKRMNIVRYNFTTTSKQKNVNRQIVSSILTTLGMENIMAKKMTNPQNMKVANMKDVGVQTMGLPCNVCEIRKSVKVNHKESQVERDHFSRSKYSQVEERELASSKMIFTPGSQMTLDNSTISLSHLTPAQILASKLATRARSMQQHSESNFHHDQWPRESSHSHYDYNRKNW